MAFASWAVLTEVGGSDVHRLQAPRGALLEDGAARRRPGDADLACRGGQRHHHVRIRDGARRRPRHHRRARRNLRLAEREHGTSLTRHQFTGSRHGSTGRAGRRHHRRRTRHRARARTAVRRGGRQRSWSTTWAAATPAKAPTRVRRSEVVDEIMAAGGTRRRQHRRRRDLGRCARRSSQQAIDEFGSLDVVVNNAGILRDAFIAGMDEAQWDAVIGVHLKGHFAVLHHAAAYWKAQSKSGRRSPTPRSSTPRPASGVTLPNAGQTNYGAAKAGDRRADPGRRRGTRTLRRAGQRDRPDRAHPAHRWPLRAWARSYRREPEEGEFDCSARRTSHRWSPTWRREKCPLTGQVFAVQGGAISTLAGWHDVRTIETDGPWSIDDIAARLPA